MRYNVRNLQEFKDAVEDCSDQDRIVIFTDERPIRIKVWDDRIELHECDERGYLIEDASPQSHETSATAATHLDFGDGED